MGNIITNKLLVKGEKEEVNKVLDFIKVEKEDNAECNGRGTIDFNKITPMPKWICGSGYDFGGISNKAEEKYGKENTYLGWAQKNWGTRLNASNLPNSYENIIYFETEWNGVPRLIQKIAWIFPNVEIEYRYYEDGMDELNISVYIFKDTEVLDKFNKFHLEDWQ
ncbi:hypothetical protein OD350_29305 (plasmid) [Clostridium beijerinckii]|uniref:DUF1281 family ferredoxin-like fold protein n=1 Tax=Clostridium beijerinckii TaxID=1520 RepID=UPI0022277738|nr:hypothetical protein [Clostridium beijerinckii]UYZ38987.1 hypothetical protein OD350_29305 [Clostridium beijerinckii]